MFKRHRSVTIAIVVFAFVISSTNSANNTTITKQLNSIKTQTTYVNQLATVGQFPFQVYIYIINVQGMVFMCGGTIISSTFVLTVAHCLVAGIEFVIYFGTIQLGRPMFTRQTRTRIVHRQYDKVTYRNDIGLLRFGSIVFSRNVKPVMLPARSDHNKPQRNTKMIISGWGMTANNTIPRFLHYNTNRMISNSECAQTFDYIFNSTLCVKRWTQSSSQITCKGDSGGPLTYASSRGTVQVGVVSFGARDGCTKGYPVALTRLTSYLDWISRETNIKIRN